MRYLLVSSVSVLAIASARDARAEDCRPSVIADRPGATTAPDVVRHGCAQLAVGAQAALSSTQTAITTPGLLRWGVLPRLEARFGLVPATLTWLDDGTEDIDGPIVGLGGKLQLVDGGISFGLLAEGTVPVTAIADGSSASARLLIAAIVEGTTLTVNMGPSVVPAASGHAGAASWGLGVSRALAGDRLAVTVDTSGQAVLGADRSYRQAVGTAIVVRWSPTVQLDAAVEVDVVRPDGRAARLGLGLVTRLW